MTKPDDIPQDVMLKANQVWHELVGAPDRDAQEQIISSAIMSARAEERERISVTLAALDSALCQFLNNANDEYDPRVWVPSIERDFRALSKAYNDCHVVGAMDLLVSAAAIRNRP